MEAICLGMAVVDVLVKGVTEFPRGGSTVFVERVGMSAGGDAVNQAITLSKLGHDVGLMTLVGDDPQGSFLLQQCAQEGVDTQGVSISKELPTSTTVVLVDEGGERSCMSQRGRDCRPVRSVRCRSQPDHPGGQGGVCGQPVLQ